MNAVADPTTYRTLLDLSMHVGVGQEAIRRYLRLGQLKADRPGSEWLFTPAQWSAAVEFFRGRGYRIAGEERENHGKT